MKAWNPAARRTTKRCRGRWILNAEAAVTVMRISGRGWIAALALLLRALAPAYAQPVTPPTAPPSRVARVSLIQGVVSFHPAGAAQWTLATINLPVIAGTALWTQPGAQAEVSLPDIRLVLDGGTELDTTALEAHRAVVSVPQGTTYIAVRLLPAGDALTVQTPRGTVALLGVGRYEVAAGDQVRPTTVTVVEGSADVAAAGPVLRVGLNQTATVTGDGSAVPFAASLAPTVPDAFLTATLAAEQPPAPAPEEARSQGVSAAIAGMTGGDALQHVGTWDSVAGFGLVWFPPVAAGFVPFREGRWRWLAPWGWTWVDEAPWGFAPAHYGRWMQIQDRWGWRPGPHGGAGFQPVFAPATVGFVGGAALAGTAAWFPLGPHRPFGPNPRPGLTPGLTVVQAGVMASGGRVAEALQPAPGAGTLPMAARPAVVPTAATPGITPAVLQRFRLPPQAGTGAPGPTLGTATPRGLPTLVQAPGATAGQDGAVPPLAIRPGAAGMVPGIVRPAPSGPSTAYQPFATLPGAAARAPLPAVIAPDRPVQTQLQGRTPEIERSESGRPEAGRPGIQPGALGAIPRREGVPDIGVPQVGLRPDAPRRPFYQPSLPRASLPAARIAPNIGFR